MFSLDKSWGDPGGLRKPIHLNRLRIDPGGPHKQKNKHSQAAPRGCEQTSNKDPGGKAPGQPRRTNNKHNNRSAHVCGDAKTTEAPRPSWTGEGRTGQDQKTTIHADRFQGDPNGPETQNSCTQVARHPAGPFLVPNVGPLWAPAVVLLLVQVSYRAGNSGLTFGPTNGPKNETHFWFTVWAQNNSRPGPLLFPCPPSQSDWRKLGSRLRA